MLSWKTQVSPYTNNGNGLFIFLSAYSPPSSRHPRPSYYFFDPLFRPVSIPLFARDFVNDGTIQLG